MEIYSYSSEVPNLSHKHQIWFPNKNICIQYIKVFHFCITGSIENLETHTRGVIHKNALEFTGPLAVFILSPFSPWAAYFVLPFWGNPICSHPKCCSSEKLDEIHLEGMYTWDKGSHTGCKKGRRGQYFHKLQSRNIKTAILAIEVQAKYKSIRHNQFHTHYMVGHLIQWKHYA